MSRDNPGLSWLNDRLKDLEDRGLRRRLVAVKDRRPGEVLLHRWVTDFSSNDYLGLKLDPRCAEAAHQAVVQQGCGAGGSRVVSGGGVAHDSLEGELRKLTSASCVIFPSGYQANVGVLSALCQPGDTIFSDAQNHASIVDGCRLSGAHVRIYPHCRWDVLEGWLTETEGRRWIVTDTVFSMDGSLAPVKELARLSAQHHAPLLVDEAHAMGVLGPEGRGYCAQMGVEPAVLVGTFSKGLGSHGAFALSSERVAHWLVNRARSFIYTTALPPAVLAANQMALTLSAAAPGSRRRKKVLDLAHRLRTGLRGQGLTITGDGTPIVSLQFNEPTRATRIQTDLLDAGHLAWAFRPPTVEPGTSRLRISLSADHESNQVDSLIQALSHRLDPGQKQKRVKTNHG